jgi:predicted nuclease of predicted toxin-antitoxin system
MGQRFKVDENLPRAARALLIEAGYDTETVHDEGLAGCPDSRLLEACVVENRILITLDMDFADIRRYPASAHRGVWVLRPETQGITNTLAALKGALSLMAKERTASRVWIVEPGRVRIRE